MNIDDLQFGFMSNVAQLMLYFLVRPLQEMYLDKKRKCGTLHLLTWKRVLTGVQDRCLRVACKGCAWYACTSHVRNNGIFSEEFMVGVHQGPVFNTSFIMVLEDCPVSSDKCVDRSCYMQMILC